MPLPSFDIGNSDDSPLGVNNAVDGNEPYAERKDIHPQIKKKLHALATLNFPQTK
jgi:hypothetical protein